MSHSIKYGLDWSMAYHWSGSTRGAEYGNSTNIPGVLGQCYYSDAGVFISDVTLQEVYYSGDLSGCACIPGTYNPPPGTDDEDACNGDPDCNPPGSPLLIAPRAHYRLTAPEAGVLFDIDGDGEFERIAWTEKYTGQTFLALDRNGNGKIDSGMELFGDYTRLKDGERAVNGFVALAEFDSNGDSQVDSLDDRWQELLLWLDENHNGLSEPEELRGVSAADISAFDVRHRWTGRRDRYGNLFKYQGFYRIHGVLRPYYDVWLTIAP